MRSATVADLRNNFANVSKWIHDGEAVVITKRGVPFATLTPLKRRKSPARIDRLTRLRKLYPEGPVAGASRLPGEVVSS